MIIDNNSTDDTTQVVHGFEGCLPIRYIFEPRQGLSSARNRALQEFRGELLVFTDDDVILDPGWLVAWSVAMAAYPDASFFGGCILPLWEGNRPKWLADPGMPLISGLLVHYDLGDQERELKLADALPFGANFAIRRQLAEALEPFRLDLGVKGGSTGRGEETEYLRRAVRAGFRGRYVSSAICFHAQDPARFRLGFLYRFGVESGRAHVVASPQELGSVVSEILFLARGLLQLLKGRGDRFRQCIINAGIQRGLRTATPQQTGGTTDVRH